MIYLVLILNLFDLEPWNIDWSSIFDHLGIWFLFDKSLYLSLKFLFNFCKLSLLLKIILLSIILLLVACFLSSKLSLFVSIVKSDIVNVVVLLFLLLPRSHELPSRSMIVWGMILDNTPYILHSSFSEPFPFIVSSFFFFQVN